jgi:prolyl-tRNA editing enzyme YbaK/EbsC (Cys-tRNA(Pro) deacylase)
MAFDMDGRTVLICMAGDARIANHAYKELFHKKAKMLKGDEVVARTSHPIGGVCPFGLPYDCEVYLDESLKRFEYVYPACGSANSAVKLTLPELETYSGYKAWINVTSLPE